ncbi:hypothetical protein J2W49_004665 [Hydrogenophaga palleronii]|uniref:Uncharacterized protein n=1 Tax=Hydrogenophaga palleronii TaxID=65655 RepID=A0ABU1WV02_9BURK|nr:hypothetical protein [Hydrogenophaga palleronii]MDR7152687.1 hypothetical protein [Hydrogenophaga palleronii]
MKTVPGTPMRRVLVAGTGGALLHAVRSCGPQDAFTVLTTRSLEGMPRQTRWAVVAPGHAWAASLPPADHAVVQLGALRRAREAVFWQPSRADLVPLAAALRERGVRTLEVLLADGSRLNAHERQRLHALAFEQWVEHRPGAVINRHIGSWPERLAAWMIGTVVNTMQQVTASLRQRPTSRVSRR